MKIRNIVGASLMAGALSLGCGGDDARLEAASDELAAARSNLEARNEDLAREEERLEKARAERDAAGEEVEEARRRVVLAQQKVEENTTDEIVFRSVQERLLQDPSLERVAIAARVSNGVVGLYGAVPDDRTRTRASEVAQSTLGVVEVQNHITIATPEVSAQP